MNARQFFDLVAKMRKSQRETPLASVEKFGSIYALMAHNLFFDDYDSFQAANTSMFGKEDWKQRLEDYFKIELELWQRITLNAR